MPDQAVGAELFRVNCPLHCIMLGSGLAVHCASLAFLGLRDINVWFCIASTVLLLAGRYWLHRWTDAPAAHSMGSNAWTCIIAATFQLASGRHEAALSSLSSLGAGVGSTASAAELDEMRQTLQRVLAQLQQLRVKTPPSP